MPNKTAGGIFINNTFYWLAIMIMMTGLYLTIRVDYLLFHSLIELFSIIVAETVFIVTWNSARYIKNKYLIIVGISYFFIGILDLLHTLSYKGMPIFTDYDYYANQLWIAARSMESCTLLLAFLLLPAKKSPNNRLIFLFYSLLTSFLIAAIFYWKIFPICFVEGKGLTDFKIYSEYVICIIIVSSIVLLINNNKEFESSVYKSILFSMIFTIISELAFTFYVDNYGISNLIGHYFKLFSFMMIYRAIVVTGIERPYELIFKELNQTNIDLRKEIAFRVQIEDELASEITERKSVELALRENEFFFKESQRATATGSYRVDLIADKWVSSEVLNAIFGIDEDYSRTISGWVDLLHPEDRDILAEYLKTEVIAGGKPFSKEYRIIRATDGATRWVHGLGEVTSDDKGISVSLIGTIQDITQRKQVEETLLEKDQRFLLATEATGVGLWEWNVMTNQIRWDSQMFRIYGIAPTADGCVHYTDWSKAVVPEDLAEQEAILNKTAMGGAQSSRQFRILRHSDGERRQLEAVETVRRNDQGLIQWVIGTNLDVTERKQAEEAMTLLNHELENRVSVRTLELREKDEMLLLQSRQAAMGEMIGNIAHQWRQPLNTLGLTIQQLALFYERGKFTKEYLNRSIGRSMEIIQHMSQTIDDFRNYFKPDKEKVEFKAQAAIATTLSLIDDSLKSKNIQTEVVQLGDPIIYGHRNEFSQALLNILNNSSDVLTERDIKESKVTITLSSGDGTAVVIVADNAGGVPEESISKVFDPYFTTKGPQRGTGVGLFMAKTIIEKNMGGRLSVRNGDDGAEFRIEV